MSARLVSVVGFALIALGSATQVSAEVLCEVCSSIARDVKRRQCWPDPFVGQDRASARAPYAVQVANGWRRQNMLSDPYFEPISGELNEAGRRKVRWILLTGPQQHRVIYVHITEKNEETIARITAIEKLASQIAPDDLPPILTTTISDEGWPAQQVDLIGRKFEASTPPPRLPTTTSGGDSTSGGGS